MRLLQVLRYTVSIFGNYRGVDHIEWSPGDHAGDLSALIGSIGRDKDSPINMAIDRHPPRPPALNIDYVKQTKDKSDSRPKVYLTECWLLGQELLISWLYQRYHRILGHAFSASVISTNNYRFISYLEHCGSTLAVMIVITRCVLPGEIIHYC